MQYVTRDLGTQLLRAARNFPAVVVTGPRRAGKTYLLMRLFPGASYHLLEDPDVAGRFRSDPQGFLDGIRLPAILDEVQHVPEAFNHVRSRIDATPRRMGQWFLTGSWEAALMSNVTESMAGRAAVLQLLPFSARESSRVGILRGGYPEALARPGASSLWFSSYVQTYLERDVRSVTAVHDLPAFRRFLALVASRHGGILNKSDIAAPLGMSVPGVGRWLNILEVTAQILVVPPFFENVGKRLIKSPKVYIADSGLACHLLGIRSAAELSRSPFAGPLFEGFIASEILKAQVNGGRRRELYYFRDQQGLEVDFIVPGESGGLRLIEVKNTATPAPDMAAPMLKLAKAWKGRGHPRGNLSMVLVHQSRKSGAISRALAPGVQAMPWTEFVC
jgi:predicted AAA+ superfamily ATPase